eukprot:517019_1
MPINYDDHGKSQLKVFIKARNKKNPTAKIRLTGKVGELRDRLKEDDIRRAKAKREETAAKKKANKKKRNKKNTVMQVDRDAGKDAIIMKTRSKAIKLHCEERNLLGNSLHMIIKSIWPQRRNINIKWDVVT